MIKYIHTSAVNQDNILFFNCSIKKSRCNLSFLFSELAYRLREINIHNSCHIISYPYVSVIVRNRDESYLRENLDEIKSTVESALFNSIKQLN